MPFRFFLIAQLEPWLYDRLIRSPTFHRGVRAIEKKVREVRHGKDPEEMGGVKTDQEEKGVFRYFFDELKEQSKGITKNKR